MLLIFQNPRFRLLWFSTVFNDAGLITHMMVHGWLALSVTDSPFWVGATAGTGGLSLMISSVFGGVVADRVDRRRLVMATQVLQAVIALGLASLIFTDQVRLWHILAVAAVQGVVISAKIPARYALILDVVGRERLLAAMAAMFASMTTMGIVAPIVAGIIVTAFDIGWAYVIIAAGYLCGAAMLLLLHGVPRVEKEASSPWEDLVQGLRYAFNSRAIRLLIMVALVGESFGWAHESMLPVMARDVLDVNASGLGYLLAGASVGALASTLTLSSFGNVKRRGTLLAAGFGGFGLFLVAFAWSSWFPLSVLLLAAAYASAVPYETAMNTLFQTSVPNEMRGRALSFQTFTWGVSALAGFHTGTVATYLGAPVAIAVGGVVVALGALRLASLVSPFNEPTVPSAESG